jgi:hypothetical protein
MMSSSKKESVQSESNEVEIEIFEEDVLPSNSSDSESDEPMQDSNEEPVEESSSGLVFVSKVNTPAVEHQGIKSASGFGFVATESPQLPSN